MADFALVVTFFSMILLPCAMASRSLRAKRSGQPDASSKIHFIDEQNRSAGLDPRHDRRALALKRSRDLYYRERAKRANGLVPTQFPSEERTRRSSSARRSAKHDSGVLPRLL